MSSQDKIKLGLLFTGGITLESWARHGTIYRDSSLYQELQKNGYEVTFITYGGAQDKELGKKLGIRVLCNDKKWNRLLYFLLLPLIHSKEIRNLDIIKSHQFIGVWPAIFSKFLYKTKYLARGGYLPSICYDRNKQKKLIRRFKQSLEPFWRKVDEWLVSQFADTICVTCTDEKNFFINKYGISPRRLAINTNWIDIEKFAPTSTSQKNLQSAVFISRYVPRKNPALFLDAAKKLPNFKITMLGAGWLNDHLQNKIKKENISVDFYDHVLPNEKLPELLNQHALYIFPTEIEGGSAKTLLEAQACGLPVVTTDTFGTRNAFIHNQTGLACSLNSNHFAEAILELTKDRKKYQNFSQSARNFIVENFSKQAIVIRELEILKALK